MLLTPTGTTRAPRQVWNRQNNGRITLSDGNPARGRKSGPSDPSFRFSLVLVPQVAVNRPTPPAWVERTHNELLEAKSWSAPWISSCWCIYITPCPDSLGLYSRMLFLALVSRWEREAVSSGKAAVGSRQSRQQNTQTLNPSQPVTALSCI